MIRHIIRMIISKEPKGVVISGTKVSTDKGYMIVSDKMDHIQVALMKNLNESV